MTIHERTAFLEDIGTDSLKGYNTGVINPYALAEKIAGRRIDWATLEDTPRFLETIFEMPYRELFDPVFKGPLYVGLGLDDTNALVRMRPEFIDREVTIVTNDLEASLIESPGNSIQSLADLGKTFAVDDLSTIKVKSADIAAGNTLQLTLRLPQSTSFDDLSLLFPNGSVTDVAWIEDDKTAGSPPDWTPTNAQWSDDGRFFNEAAEYFDPVQGSVANCYFIAALSAVAWARPYEIQHMARATGTGNQSFTNLIRFYKPDSGGQIDKEIEVTDALPRMNGSGGAIYCRSSEAGENWPGLYEKAFAKLKTGHTGDKPDITATGWGDSCWATAQLTGGTRKYWSTASTSADDLWDAVRANSRNYRTFNPMTCGTYSSASAADRDIDYSDANIVASHAYSVLGWAYRNNRKYIVVRNPWGRTEGTAGALTGTIHMMDVDWWRPIALAPNDGVFAIEAADFKTYFAVLCKVA